MSVRTTYTLSRRGFCVCCAVAAAGFATNRGWLKPTEAFAESRNIVDTIRDSAAAMPLQLHKLRGNVTVIEGSSGNIAVLTGEDGKLFIDAGISATRPRIIDAVNSLGRDPIKHLINTHWHFDHTDGNQWLNKEGAAVLAHENTHEHLLTAQRVVDWDYKFSFAPFAAVPTEVFASEKTVSINRSTLNLKHYGSAHTDGDISVIFADADILHCGDTYWNGIYPFIDYSTGGNIDGMIRAAEWNIAAAGSQTIVIPGHNLPNHARGRHTSAGQVALHDRTYNADRNIATADPTSASFSICKSGVKPELWDRKGATVATSANLASQSRSN